MIFHILHEVTLPSLVLLISQSRRSFTTFFFFAGLAQPDPKTPFVKIEGFNGGPHGKGKTNPGLCGSGASVCCSKVVKAPAENFKVVGLNRALLFFFFFFLSF